MFVLGMHWLLVLKPEKSADGLAMHLAIPAGIASHHFLPFEPNLYMWSVMPMGGDFCYSIVYLFGGEFASRLLTFAALLLVLGLLNAAVRGMVPAVRPLSHPAALRRHSDGPAGHRIALRREPVGRGDPGGDHRRLAVRRNRAVAIPLRRDGAGRHGDGMQVRIAQLCR